MAASILITAGIFWMLYHEGALDRLLPPELRKYRDREDDR